MAITPRLRHLLELESGSNDPASVFLTIGMIGLIQGTSDCIGDLLGLFVVQMGVGIVAGVVLARGAVLLINRLHLEYDGLYPVLTVAFVLLTYEGAASSPRTWRDSPWRTPSFSTSAACSGFTTPSRG